MKRGRLSSFSTIILLAGIAAHADNYVETFNGPTDPSAVAAAGWSIVTGTNNPTAVAPDFGVNNNQNVVKITNTNDAGSDFTSAHLFIENDFLASDPNNFGRGDALIYTSEPITQAGATSMNLNGAYISVDYENGDAFNGGPSGYFAFRTANGRWWIYESGFLGNTTAAMTHKMMSTDPLDDTFTCIPLIFEPWNGYNCDVRLIPDDSNARELSVAEWASITAFGIYSAPSYDVAPARFDNFTITNFTLNGVPPCDPCDANCDGSVNPFDIQPFIGLLGGGAGCSPCAADANADGTVNPFDIGAFLACIAP